MIRHKVYWKYLSPKNLIKWKQDPHSEIAVCNPDLLVHKITIISNRHSSLSHTKMKLVSTESVKIIM